MSKIIHIENNDIDNVLKDNEVVLLDFHAKWCGPCRMISPVIEKLADKFEGKVVVVKINTDENQDLTMKYSIRSIPAVLIVKKEKVEKFIVGAQSESFYTEALESVLK